MFQMRHGQVGFGVIVVAYRWYTVGTLARDILIK